MIYWNSNRKLQKFEIDIEEYYKNLVKIWNEISEPTDGRTTCYKTYHRFNDELVYMWDMIKQTKEERQKVINMQAEKIRELEKELSKWRDQQKGKSKKLTIEQKEQVINWKNKSISNREIAKRLKISEGTIRNFLKGL